MGIRRVWVRRRRAVRAGAALVGIGALVAWGLVLWGLIRASDSEVGRQSNYAQVAALMVVTVGPILALLGRRRSTVSAEALDKAVSALAQAVGKRESEERVRLLGLTRVDTRPADIAFEKSVIHYRHVGGRQEGTLATVLAYYKSLTPRRLVIIGKAGSGKSVLALELLVEILSDDGVRLPQDDTASRRRVAQVPVRFSPASWDPKQPFAEWLREELVDVYGQNQAVAAQLIDQQLVLPVLDGLDEMDSDLGHPTRAEAAIAQLNSYLDIRGPGLAPIIVTCRQERYEQLHDIEATCIQILPLTSTQIDQYIRQHFTGLDEEWRWQSFLEELSDQADNLATSVNTPWMLTLLLTSTRDPEDPLVPAELARMNPTSINNALLGRFVPAVTRLRGQQLGRRKRIQPEEATWQLRVIADYVSRQGTPGSDLLLHRCWTIAGIRGPRNLHAICAFAGSVLATTVVAWATIGSPVVWAAAIRSSLLGINTLSTLLAWVLATLALAGLPVWTARRAWRLWPEPHQLRLRAFSPHHELRYLVPLAALGGIGCVLGIAAGLTAGRALGVSVGVSAALAVGLATLARRETEMSAVFGPRSILRNDMLSGLAGILVFGLGGAVAGLITYGRWPYLALGGLVGVLAAAFGYWPAFGSAAAMRYGLAIWFMGPRSLRLGFGPFLQWAYDVGLLRVSGAAYQFRHKELQRWLASPSASQAEDLPPSERSSNSLN